MDCNFPPENEFARLSGRPVSAAFHVMQIEQVLRFIRDWLPDDADADEIREACAEALEALAHLNARLAA
jgi:hypothetical protein